MKHSRVTAGSFAAVLNPLPVLTLLAGLAGGPAVALPARDGHVPFTEHVISTTADYALSVFATDVDGDGDTDVLSASRDDNKIAWYESDGGSPPTFTEHVISTTADHAMSVFATDLDGDGDTDVLSASSWDDKIAWYRNDGGSPPTFTERAISTNADQATAVFATDVDGDGDTDVLSASLYDDKIAWHENDGASPPSFTERVISTTAQLARVVFATDVDGDGDIDVLSAYDTKIAWYENPGWTEHVITHNAFGPRSVFATDVDGDGDTDVLSASDDNNKIRWYKSDGGSPPSFTQRVISPPVQGASSVFATDVDGDGDIDVLSASGHDHTIAWNENDGRLPAGFTHRVISITAEGASSVFATDVDGDGDTDVLSASAGGKIAWYENRTPTCGNGTVAGSEECDDGNTDYADGCSLTCAVEDGWECMGEPSECTEICGDGLIVGDERCDPPDGQCCSDTCTFEAAGTACPDDGNDCTGDECARGGVCDHPNLVAGTTCDDGEECTVDDRCTGEPDNDCAGEYQVQVYADICLPYDPPNAPQPDLDDILCLLDDATGGTIPEGCACNGFRKTTDLYPCPEDGGGDGEIALDDILVMLDCFAGICPCDDQCPE